MTAFAQTATAPRLRTGSPPPPIVEAIGGGEVVLELSIDASGGVTRVDRVRSTPPYTDALTAAVGEWRFAPATGTIAERRAAVPSKVLLIGLFRPPTLYAGPSPGAPPSAQRAPSPDLPQADQLVMPAYPPTALGDATVLVEIELTAGARPGAYRTVSPAAGFDGAALEAARAWRFRRSRDTTSADPIFVYGVFGFRAPILDAVPQSR